MKQPYHTAIGSHKTEVVGAKPVTRWTGPQGVAFVHDASGHFPDEYRACDVLYAEPAWRPGYDFFAKRAGIVPKLAWIDWMSALNANILELGKPAVVMCGKSALKVMQTSKVQPAKLRGTNAFAAIYGDVGPLPLVDTDIIAKLASRFSMVGDFACGYGRTGRAFVEQGGQFVMSDISAECIGFIATAAPTWSPAE